MNLLKFFSLIFSLFLFYGCEVQDSSADGDYKIEFGSACGWCAGEEFIIVTGSKISYYKNIPCGENKGKTEKSRKISISTWDAIISSFDYNEFLKLNSNTCNVCVDGCDEIIRITRSGNQHEIRYSPGDDIQQIRKMRLILSEQMKELR